MPAIYDPSKPLISIHIPKTGGTTVGAQLRSWFKKGYLRHRSNVDKGTEQSNNALENYQCIHGHFNRFKNQGVDNCYPQAQQFITFLRDPFEQHASLYFHKIDRAANPRPNANSLVEPPTETFEKFILDIKEGSREIPGTFVDIFMDTPVGAQALGGHNGLHSDKLTEAGEVKTLSGSMRLMIGHLPERFLPFNANTLFVNDFIHIGITEMLSASMMLLAKKLNKVYVELPPRNVSQRTMTINPALRAEHQKLFPNEHAFYEKIKELHRLELIEAGIAV